MLINISDFNVQKGDNLFIKLVPTPKVYSGTIVVKEVWLREYQTWW